MALGMMLPGMVSGWIQEQIGYRTFVWVCIATIPAFVVTALMNRSGLERRKMLDFGFASM